MPSLTSCAAEAAAGWLGCNDTADWLNAVARNSETLFLCQTTSHNSSRYQYHIHKCDIIFEHTIYGSGMISVGRRTHLLQLGYAEPDATMVTEYRFHIIKVVWVKTHPFSLETNTIFHLFSFQG